MKNWFFNLISIFFFITVLYAQKSNAQKSVPKLSFDDIEKRIINENNDNIKQKIAQDYLATAKTTNDKLDVANGYYLLANYCSEHITKYADSLIFITKEIKHHKYPAQGFLIKGNVYYELANYKEALNQYLISLDYASKSNNQIQYSIIKFNIGLLKNTLGNRKEALKIFEENINYIETNKLQEQRKSFYLSSLYALADAYTLNNMPDSSSIYTKIGINTALKTRDEEMYAYLIANSGINLFFKKEYLRAIDSLEKGKYILKKIGDNEIRVAICDYYIARSLRDQGKIQESIQYFKKVDTILRKTKDVLPELIRTYDFLVKYYKSVGDKENEVLYINHLIKLDSIRDANYKYLTNTINKKYDTRILLTEKEELISQLEEDKTFGRKAIMYLIILAIVLSLAGAYFIYRTNLLKMRFNNIMEIQNEKLSIDTKNKNRVLKNEESTNSKNNSDDLDISENLINDLLIKIDKFEKTGRFTKKQYTLNVLAKELGTNSSYLSKIINANKKTSFSQYINNLRINYAIAELTKNSLLRSYTIKAIASEFGFNTAQSFTTAFHKSTGMYPSYFIKQLKNEEMKREKTNWV